MRREDLSSRKINLFSLTIFAAVLAVVSLVAVCPITTAENTVATFSIVARDPATGELESQLLLDSSLSGVLFLMRKQGSALWLHRHLQIQRLVRVDSS